jgi:hypothetical protein
VSAITNSSSNLAGVALVIHFSRWSGCQNLVRGSESDSLWSPGYRQFLWAWRQRRSISIAASGEIQSRGSILNMIKPPEERKHRALPKGP